MASELDLDAYLARIGERAPLAPDVDGLASLHRAHCAAIPFQNLDLEAALEALGFRAFALAARVPVGTTEVRPRTHMLLRVDLPEGAFLAGTRFRQPEL